MTIRSACQNVPTGPPNNNGWICDCPIAANLPSERPLVPAVLRAGAGRTDPPGPYPPSAGPGGLAPLRNPRLRRGEAQERDRVGISERIEDKREAPVDELGSHAELLTGGWSAAQLDSGTAHPARMYDYYLGGRDNYTVDRVAAD